MGFSSPLRVFCKELQMLKSTTPVQNTRSIPHEWKGSETAGHAPARHRKQCNTPGQKSLQIFPGTVLTASSLRSGHVWRKKALIFWDVPIGDISQNSPATRDGRCHPLRYKDVIEYTQRPLALKLHIICSAARAGLLMYWNTENEYTPSKLFSGNSRFIASIKWISKSGNLRTFKCRINDLRNLLSMPSICRTAVLIARCKPDRRMVLKKSCA